MKYFTILLFVFFIACSTKKHNQCIEYLVSNNQSMNVVAIPFFKDGANTGFFMSYNKQIYQVLYLNDYYNLGVKYNDFLISLLKGEVELDSFIYEYDIEIIKYDYNLINSFILDEYLIMKDGYYYIKNNITTPEKYNIVKLMFDECFQVYFDDYSGEYFFKKITRP